MSEARTAVRLSLRCREDPETVRSTVSTTVVVYAGSGCIGLKAIGKLCIRACFLSASRRSSPGTLTLSVWIRCRAAVCPGSYSGLSEEKCPPGRRALKGGLRVAALAKAATPKPKFVLRVSYSSRPSLSSSSSSLRQPLPSLTLASKAFAAEICRLKHPPSELLVK